MGVALYMGPWRDYAASSIARIMKAVINGTLHYAQAGCNWRPQAARLGCMQSSGNYMVRQPHLFGYITTDSSCCKLVVA